MKIYEVQKWIKHWGWIKVSRTPIREQAEEAVENGRKFNYRMRVVEVKDED